MAKIKNKLRCKDCYNRSLRPNECLDCFLNDHFVPKRNGKRISKNVSKASKRLKKELKYEHIKNR